MENVNIYVLKRGTHARYEGGRRVEYKQGETFVPTNSELEAFKDKLELFKTVKREDINNDPPRAIQDADLVDRVLSKRSGDDFVLVIKDGNKIDKKELRKKLSNAIKELFPKENE